MPSGGRHGKEQPGRSADIAGGGSLGWIESFGLLNEGAKT